VPKICMIAVESFATLLSSSSRSSSDSVVSFTIEVSTPYFSNCFRAFCGNTSIEPIFNRMLRSAVPASAPKMAFSPSVSISPTDSSTEMFMSLAVVPNFTIDSLIWFTVAAPACEPAAKILITRAASSASNPNWFITPTNAIEVSVKSPLIALFRMIACSVTEANASAFSSKAGCALAIFSAASATSVPLTFNRSAVSITLSLNTSNLSPVSPVIADSEAKASSL